MERAAEVVGAVGEEAIERCLEGDRLGVPERRLVEGRIDGAVEDQGTHSIRVGVGVHRADEGPVREPEVGELVVPDRGTDDVEVLDDISRADMGEKVAVAPLAAVGERLLAGEHGRPLLIVIGGEVRGEEMIEVVDAPDRRARVHAPRVEADDVEPCPDRFREQVRTRALDELDAGLAWSSRVDEE